MLLAELFPYANAVFYVFTALYIITAIGCIIVVVSENRNPVRSLAWVTVLLLLPVVGILVYLFFGRSLKSVMMISRNNRMKRRGQVSLNTPESSNFSLSESSLQIINLVNSLGEPHFFKTNQVDIFTEGEAKFSQLKADLLAAIREVGALMQTAGVKNTQVNEWVYRSLAALDSSDEKAAEQLTEAPAIKAALA